MTRDRVVLGIDQGTSSTRCLVVGSQLEVLAAASRPVEVRYPRPGWVEQDAEEILTGVLEAVDDALNRAGLGLDRVGGIGIANQTETFVVWDREDGRPVHPAIVWQCRRTAEECERLRAEGAGSLVRKRTGLELDPTFSATKVRWLLDNVDGLMPRAAGGELAFGDIASWLIWSLSGGARHVTEPSNACRTALVDLSSLEWDEDLLALFGVPSALLPTIRPSGSILAETDASVMGARVPIAGALGDQQASLFGQQCWSAGQGKLTLGTGAFLWVNAGPEPPTAPEGILASCGWRLADDVAYALEGFVPAAGAVVSWLVETGVVASPEATEALALAASLEGPAEGEPEVWFVPALAGLGAPSWDARARGTLLGLSRASGALDIVRAGLEGVAHQVVDALDAMEPAVEGGLEELRVDGGVSGNDWMLQRLADLSGRTVHRAASPEATAIGVATLAGLTVGLWPDRGHLAGRWRMQRSFEPAMGVAHRERLRARWVQARELARSWR